jgi:hypothetical protein
LETVGAMTEPRIVFDPEPHRYWHITETGVRRELPSVTAVLKAAGYARTDFLSPVHAQRGTDVHDATLVVDRYPQDWERRISDDPVGNYAESYAKLLADHTVVWQLSEQVVADTTLGVAGRLDRVGLLDGFDALADFKSGDDDPAYGPQTAGYERMAPRVLPVRRKRWVILLQKDGSRARFVPKPERADYDAFIAAVHVYYWRKANGRLS